MVTWKWNFNHAWHTKRRFSKLLIFSLSFTLLWRATRIVELSIELLCSIKMMICWMLIYGLVLCFLRNAMRFIENHEECKDLFLKMTLVVLNSNIFSSKHPQKQRSSRHRGLCAKKVKVDRGASTFTIINCRLKELTLCVNGILISRINKMT